MGTEFFIAVGVFPVELHVLAYQFSMVCTANLAKIALFSIHT